MQQGLAENLTTFGINTIIVCWCYNLSKYFRAFCKGVQKHSNFTNKATEWLTCSLSTV